MKKKNLIILLIIPFIISLLGIVTINISINTFYGDITGIEWEYDDVEAFQLKENVKYELKATPLNASNAPLDSGNGLIWTCENKDTTLEQNVADIVYENDKYYLKTNINGETIITCSNFKGNVFRKMTAVVYTDGVIILTPSIASSQNNIDENIYYGQYDLVNNEKKEATIAMNIKCIPEDLAETVYVKEQSNNIQVNIDARKINVIGTGDAYLSIGVIGASSIAPSSFEFKIIENGVNVYSYNDLLSCTNRSSNGEIICLRKSFETNENLKLNSSNNLELFGTYNSKERKYNFEDEVYRFETTANQEFIKQWNDYADDSNGYKDVDNRVIAGLRVQKDFYGNGYTINLHNLTYPSETIPVEGTDIEVPTLGLHDLFRGPLPYYTLGDPNGMPMVTAYGQDNIGVYVDGDNITINDVNIKNCELKGSLSFLSTVGTVMDVNGDNVTIKNSRLSNGKNILRCFSTQNFIIDNSLLSNAMNFLMNVGANEYLTYDETTIYDFVASTGETINTTLYDYVGYEDTQGDNDLLSFLMGNFDNKENMRNSLLTLQNVLNHFGSTKDIFKGTITINDTFFYNSGISSIALESAFNGPFLYSAMPSLITSIFSGMEMDNQKVVPYTPTKIGGTSYPVKVDINGKTKFYDYKDSSQIDISGLIYENISVIASEVFGKEASINIDTIFPIKPMLLSQARSNNYVYRNNEKEFINIPIAYYGGGLNLSQVNIDGLENDEEIGNQLEIDFLSNYLNLVGNGEDIMGMMKDVMLKCVTLVSGFEPFKFVCIKGNGYLYGEAPKVSDLIANAKGV